MQLVLSGCGNADGVEIVDGNLEATIVNEETEENAATDNEENVATDTNENDMSDKHITVIKHNVICKSDESDEVLAEGSYPEIILDDGLKKENPELSKYIDELNENFEKENLDMIADDGANAKDSNIKAQSGTLVEVKRADGKVLTLYISGFGEAAVLYSYVNSKNLVFTTGDEVKINQVINDPSSFAEGILAGLNKEHADLVEECWGTDEKENIKRLEGYINDDQLTYFVNEEGIRVDFDETFFAHWCMPDDVYVMLSNADYPELINKEYAVDTKQNLDEIVEYKEVEEPIIVAPSVE
ncbi:MAG: hypothetical protein J5802_07115 [Butyrivibrio sp.]|nr:hypothetical protein [Butyrivibrio sp.]